MVQPQVLCTGCFFCLEQALLPESSWLVPSPAPRSLLKSPLAGTLPHHPAYLKWHTQPQLSTPFCFTFLSSPYHTQYTLLVLLTFCPPTPNNIEREGWNWLDKKSLLTMNIMLKESFRYVSFTGSADRKPFSSLCTM